MIQKVGSAFLTSPCLIISSQVLEFVDDHGNEVLNLGSFALLPLHVVRLILMREELKADEFSKFQARISYVKGISGGKQKHFL